MNDRQLVLDTVEEICADTNNIDEVCMALEHSTIFATEMIQNLVEVIDKYKDIIDRIKDDLKKTIQYNVKSHDIFGNRFINVDLDHIKHLLELLEGVDE